MSNELKYLSDNDFKSTIESGLTLVDFYADWCGPCKMMEPIVDELAKEMSGKATIAKLDIETAQQTASSYSVTSIPTLILYKDGDEVQRFVGVKTKEDLSEAISNHL